MKKFVFPACLVGLMASSTFVSGLCGAEDEKVATIKEVMAKLHKGANSPLVKVKKGLAAESTSWKDIQKATKEFAILGADLPKNEPPKGEKEDYKKLADAYCSSAKALNVAAGKEDKTAAESAFKKISTSCAACHKAHKPN